MQLLRRVALALTLAWLLPCALAHAEVSVSVSPFDPETGPIGISACEEPISFAFSGQTLHEDGSPLIVDVWWAPDETVDCAVPTTRVSGACKQVTLAAGSLVSTSHGVTLTISAATLFADAGDVCVGTNTSRVFYFFDAAVAGDVVTVYDVSRFVTRVVRIDTVAPRAPELDGDAVGDSAITLGWIPATSDPSPASLRFYLDPAGCPRSGVPGSLRLIAGAAAPSSLLVYTDDAPSEAGTTTFDTTLLQWPPARYGDTGVVAMTALDDAGNESPLSNLVCVYHTPCAGGDGGTSADCAPASGCAIARGRRNEGAFPLASIALVGYVIARRWKRFSSSRA